MICRVFRFIELMLLNFMEGFMRITSNKTFRALAMVSLSVTSEIFMYMILGLCCVFISLIVQVHDIIEKDVEQPVEQHVGGDTQIATLFKQK